MPKLFIPGAEAGPELSNLSNAAAETYTQNANTSKITEAGIAANVQVGSDMAQAAASHGQEVVSQGLKLLNQAKGSFDDFAYNKAMTAASTEFNQAVLNRTMQQTDDKGNPTWPTLTKDITTLGNNIYAKYSSNIASPDVAKRFGEDFNQLIVNHGTRSISEAAKQQVSFAQAGLADAVKKQSVNAIADPNPANRDSYFNIASIAIDNGVKNGYISPTEAASLKENARSAIYKTSLDVMNTTNPLQVKEMLKTHSAADLRLNAVEYAQLVKSNEVAINSLDRKNREQEAMTQKQIAVKQSFMDDELRLGIREGKVQRADVEGAYKRNEISHPQYIARSLQLLEEQNSRDKWSNVSANITYDVQSGVITGNKYTSAQIDKHYNEQIDQISAIQGKPADIRTKGNEAAKYTVPVKAFQSEVSGLMQSGTPKQMIEAAKSFYVAAEKNPALTRNMNAKDLAAAAYVDRQSSVGGDPDQIAKYVKDNIYGATDTAEKERLRQFSSQKEFSSQNINQTVRDVLGADSGFNKTLTGDLTGLTTSLLKDAYAKTGDSATAIKQVQAQLKDYVGTSEMNKNRTMMLLPPEKAYPGVPAEVLREDLNASIGGIIPKGDKADDYNVESNHLTISSIDPTSTSKPSYLIYKTDAQGNKVYLTDPETGVPKYWQFDQQQTSTDQRQALEAQVQNTEIQHLKDSGTATPVGTAMVARNASGLIAVANSFVGLNEVRDRDILAQTLYKCTGVRIDPSRTPWCAAFVNAVLASTGHQTSGSLRAADFLNYGAPTTTPNQGDIVVLQPMAKGSSGHVGLFDGYEVRDGVRYVKVLGGNQSGGNVAISLFPESAVRGYRVPPDAYDIKNASQTVPEFRPETYMQPRGLRNNNPGNLRLTDTMWPGEVTGKDQAFKTFATPEDGIRGIFTSISKKQARGLNTIEQIINSYAPPSENNTQQYINAVAKQAGLDPTQPLDLSNKDLASKIIAAIITHENGKNPYSIQHIRTALGD